MAPNSSLLQWLATFEVNGQALIELKEDTFFNLADGFICARILNQISPQYFSDKWLDGIKPVPPNGSWRLRVSNLKRILQKIHDYASDLQSPQFKQPSVIGLDVAVIAQNFDSDQISRLIQLILFCAINCDRKQEYIERIRVLPTQVKQDIKEAIEEFIINSNNNNNYDNSTNTASSNQQRLNNSSSTYQANNGADELGDNNNFNLSDQQTLNDSRQFNLNASNTSNNILSSNRTSVGSAHGQRSFLRRDSSGDTSKRNELAHHDISSQSNYFDGDNNSNETFEQLKQKLNLALAIQDEKAQACHELELKLEELKIEREQLAFENEKLLNEKIVMSPRKLSDTSRHKAMTTSPSARYDIDLTLDSTEFDDRSSKNLDDSKVQNMILQQNRKLQSELNRLKEALIKIETEKEDYRLKSVLLTEDLDRMTVKHDKLQSKAEQAKRLQDELDEHKQSSERVDNYKTIVENLVKKNNDLKRGMKVVEEENLAYKRKIILLEEESSRFSGSNREVEIYKNQLHEIQVRLSQETYKAEKAELELARISDRYNLLKKEYEKLCETTNQLVRNGINATIRHNSPESLGQGSALDNPNISDNTLTLINRIEELQRQLFQKDQELTDCKAKYKINIQKAKKVVETLNNNQSIHNSLQQSCISSTSSFNCSSMDETNILKQRLIEREQRLIEVEREFYEYKKIKEIHERLIISAFYGLTTPMHWKNVNQRLERTSLTSPQNQNSRTSTRSPAS